MPCTEVSALGDFSVVARGIFLISLKHFPFGCLWLMLCCLEKERKLSNIVCDVATEFPVG